MRYGDPYGMDMPNDGTAFAEFLTGYPRDTAPAARHYACLLWNSLRSGEQTEAYAKAQAAQCGVSADDVEALIAAAVDAGIVVPTIIDGREHGFVPALRRPDEGGLEDRAREWVSEQYPEASDQEWTAHYRAALCDLRAIDAAADAADTAGAS